MTNRTMASLGKRKSLGEVDLLHELPTEEIWTLTTLAREQIYQRGQPVEGIGRDGGGVFAILHGSVRIFLSAPDGRQLWLRYRYPGEIFELQENIPGSAVVTVLEATVDDTVVANLPWATFLEIVSPRATHVVDALVRQTFEDERRTVRELAFSTVKARLAHVLASLVDGAFTVVVRKTREELAAMAGTRPEEVTRLLAELRDDGFIAYQPYDRSLVIVQPQQLAVM